MPAKKIAIMQPTYLPWIGYFALMDAVDEFVLLDDVQFARKSWQQRNRIKDRGDITMLTVPVRRTGRLDSKISEIEIDWSADFAGRHCKSIELAYEKAPSWTKYSGGLLAAITTLEPLLVNYDIALIERIRGDLGIKTPLVRSSSLPIDGKREDRLISICRQLEACVYISPTGSSDYLSESDAFQRVGIKLLYNDYRHPTYPQLHGKFVTHLSAIDILLNCGEKSLEIIRRGVNLIEAAEFHAR